MSNAVPCPARAESPQGRVKLGSLLAAMGRQARLSDEEFAVFGLRAGVALLPAGKRRSGLQENLEKRVLPLFAGRVLPFDLACTQAYAALMANARTAGLAIATADGYIAAIAAANGFAVATRDTSALEAAGGAVINPWQP